MRYDRRFEKWILSAMLAAGAVGMAVAADGFDLRVNDTGGPAGPWPLVGGLPFPEGRLHDAGQIRVVDGAGLEVPAQIDVAATWRDGSVRWALAGMHADPRAAYRVEFGPGVERAPPPAPLRVEESGGRLVVDTGAAKYEFVADRLLPETAWMDGVVVLAASGAGAYLVDNHDRRACVAGAEAQITSEISRAGPVRAVIRREGWYVTASGERIARARAWFYFTAGSPSLRVTHSLVFTEDTNELWVRDYGLEFNTPGPPVRAIFPVGGRQQEELPATAPVVIDEWIETPVKGEVYMLQDLYPHFLDRETRAVVGSLVKPPPDVAAEGEDIFWVHDWIREMPAVGDWVDGAFDGYGLTVVTPWLAQQFPKEIACGPQGMRVALWSARSGRELDFRAVTLVNEYWRGWSTRAPGGADALADRPSNAQCAARTHDVWLLPRRADDDLETVRARAAAASRPPLVLADPAWMADSMALGWLTHPVDRQRFPEEELVLSEFWDRLMERYEELRRTGLIAWGAPPRIRGAGSGFFRESALVDYGLRRHVWNLYARSGDRRYFEYATRFNRFAGDWSLAHWDAGRKFTGGFTNDRDFWNAPIYWGSFTQLEPVGGNTGHDIVNWMMEYYLAGDEYAMELVRMHGEAYKRHWEHTARNRARYDGIHMILRVMANLYAVDWDETLGGMAHELARYVIDMDVPNAISDEIRFGSLYKVDRNLISLYYYYKETGDELARAAFLRGIEYEYRFNRVGGAFGGQSYPSFLFAVAYRWTGNPDYLRVVKSLIEEHRRWDGGVNITSQINPTMGVPAALSVLAGAEEVLDTVDPFPLLRQSGAPQPSSILLRKTAGQPVNMRLHVRMANDVGAQSATTAQLAPHPASGAAPPAVNLPLEVEVMQSTERSSRTDLRRRHVRLTIPADKPAGLYTLQFPDIHYADVLESDAVELAAYAPEGFRMQGARAVDYFSVPDDLDQLHVFLGVPTAIIRPDGTVALEADRANIGELRIPVAGQGGNWGLHPSQSGIVRLLNTEPLFTRTPQRMVTDAGVRPAPRFERPSDEMAFVPGPDTQALHLPARTTLNFPRGDEHAAAYAHFPGAQGTVEFWFRPNWSSIDLPFGTGISFNDLYFLRAGSHDLRYRRGRARRLEMAALQLWAYGTDSSAGFTGRFWFEAGEWYHLAFTWRTQDGLPGDDGDYAVYVNGRPVSADNYERPDNARDQFWPGRVGGHKPFQRRAAGDRITIGPLDGSIAQLRISDGVRYTTAFDPPLRFDAGDEQTLALFPLDGDFEGWSRSGADLKLK